MTGFDPAQHWEDRHRRLTQLHAVGYLGLGEPFNRWLYRVKRVVFLRHMRGRLPRLAATRPGVAGGACDTGIESARLAPAAAAVLDIGCGSGFFVERWKELGMRRIWGLDLSPTAVERLRLRHPDGRFAVGDVGAEWPIWSTDESRGASLPDAADPWRSGFDAVSAMDVLYHIVDDARFVRALRNISRALRPGGWFVMSDNFVHGPTLRVADQVSHSIDTLVRWLGDAGFDIELRTPLFALMNYPVDSRSRLLRLVWRCVERAVSLDERLGHAAGAMLFPFEIAAVSMLREGPTTELVIARKRPHAGSGA